MGCLWRACVGALVGLLPVALPAAERVPVIYCTDLFHPHDDPDDHFDLAAIYALPELDLQGIVLDQGEKQTQRPGRIPVAQMNHLTSRSIPTVLGLATPLSSPADAGTNQPAAWQAGVRLILDTLRNSPEPVALITVGSVRDVVAAFNREPELVRRRTARVLCFIGEASDPAFREYNVGLDLHAYVGLLRSGLPVDWVPCFDGGLWQNHGHASFWKARHAELLERAPDVLVKFLIYAMEKETSDPLAFLARPVDPAQRARLFAGERNLWCTAIFAAAAHQVVTFDGTRVRWVRAPGEAGLEPSDALFGFETVQLSVSDAGVVTYGPGPDARRVRRFVVRDPVRYAAGMTRATADLLTRVSRSESVNE